MARLRYSSAARDDLAEIAGYITRQSGSRHAATHFIAQLHAKCRELASSPFTMGRPRPELRPDLRSYAFKGYVIFFRYTGDTLEVVDVLEGHRDIEGHFSDM